jgi:hypothetical protein
MVLMNFQRLERLRRLLAARYHYDAGRYMRLMAIVAAIREYLTYDRECDIRRHVQRVNYQREGAARVYDYAREGRSHA